MTNSRFIVYAIIWLALLAFGAQCLIDFSNENLASACLVLGSSLLVLLYILWSPAIQSHPLSTFAIFGFCVTTQLGAMIAQSIYWTPLVWNLRQPVDTFLTLAFFQLIALCAHVFYRFINRPSDVNGAGPVESMLTRINLYTTPTVGVLWAIGLIGFASLVLRSVGGGAGAKLAQGLSFMAWAPFLIPIYMMEQGRDYCSAKKHTIFLVLYVSLFVVYGLALNTRGVMFSGAVTVALFLLLMGLRNGRPLNKRWAIKGLGAFFLIGMLTIPLNYLAAAMVVVRMDASITGPLEKIQKTIDVLQRPEEIDRFKETYDSAKLNGNYDEVYIKHTMMARFVETKFHDNALYFSKRLIASDVGRLASITEDFFWATLPDPMIKALDIDVEKTSLFFSMGDYISHLAGAGGLGGYKTGSGFAQGIALFGPVFPLLYFLACFVMFWALDIFSFRRGGAVVISTVGMLGVWRLFQYGISAESLQYEFMSIFRGLPQGILLYILAYHFARAMNGVVTRIFSTRHSGLKIS